MAEFHFTLLKLKETADPAFEMTQSKLRTGKTQIGVKPPLKHRFTFNINPDTGNKFIAHPDFPPVKGFRSDEERFTMEPYQSGLKM